MWCKKVELMKYFFCYGERKVYNNKKFYNYINRFEQNLEEERQYMEIFGMINNEKMY